MSRDDEIAIIQRKDNTWWVGLVKAQNYHYHNDKGQFTDLNKAVKKAIKLDKHFGFTEYGIRIHNYSEFEDLDS